MSAVTHTPPSFDAFRQEVSGSLAPPNVLSPNQPVWIFGAGQFGRDVCQVLIARGFDVAGFVETMPQRDTVNGLPLLAWGDLSHSQRQSQIAIGIYNRGMPLDELAALARSHGATQLFFPWDLYDQFEAELGWRYWLGSQALLTSNLDNIERSFHRLADANSQQCLLDICRFRLGLFVAYASFTHSDAQYFNALTLGHLRGPALHYVDGGAYNGDTLLELQALHAVERAYLFEPDPSNFDALVRNTQSFVGTAQCLPLALSDRHQTLSFNAGSGEGAAISEQGTSHITAVALDSIVGKLPVDFLKLDVEGAEVAALQGGQGVIRRSRPVMALSLYHRPEDIWAIPDTIAAIADGYDLYLRQHFANSFDSVLYAVPR